MSLNCFFEVFLPVALISFSAHQMAGYNHTGSDPASASNYSVHILSYANVQIKHLIISFLQVYLLTSRHVEEKHVPPQGMWNLHDRSERN